MTPNQLARCADRLEEFLSYSFGGLGRLERREALSLYLQGLLLDGERKSMVPIAARLVDDESEVEGCRQRLQQAISVADWDAAVVFERIARRADEKLPGIDAWVVDDTGFPKKGFHSVGVQRQYSGTLGRIDNCQVTTSLHLASEEGGICIGMQLYLPKSWADDRKRCRKAGVPRGLKSEPKWKNALTLIDRALQWEVTAQPVVGDAEFGNNHRFREALEKRGLHYVLNVASHLVVWPPGVVPQPPPPPSGRAGRPRTRWTSADGSPLSIQEVADSLPRSAWRTLTWRQSTRGPQRSRFAAVRVRTAHRHKEGRAPSDEMWLLCEWPARAKKPTTFWLSSLPPRTARKRLVYLAKLRWRIERDYQEMKSQLGLDHFEGRTWRGFHHHCACVAAAHAFLTLERALSPPQQKKVVRASSHVSRV